jgi:uncharacterized protein (DUF2062 family)
MRNLFRKFLPSHDTVKSQRWLKPFGSWLHHPNLWHLHRRSVAGGVAVGLFCGLVPGPLQVISAALLAVLLRVNLPVAAFTTLYTNPFTILPLYWVAYKPLLIGLPLLALILSVIGYFVVRLVWRVGVVLRWQARKRRRAG